MRPKGIFYEHDNLYRPQPFNLPLPSSLVKTGLTIYIGLGIGVKIGKCMVSTLDEYELFVLDEEEED